MDGRMLGPGGTGVSHYAVALAAAQAMLTGDNWVLTDESQPGDRIGRWLVAATGRARRARQDRGNRLVTNQLFRAAHVHFGLYGRLLHVRLPGPPGIMHWSYPVPIRAEGWRNIYTVHDVIPIDHPELSSVSPVRLAAVLRRILSAAERIVTVSDHARGRIIARTGYAADRVVNCYQSVAIDSVTRATDPTDWPFPFAPGSYHLVCGSVEPRKNVARIIAAHAQSGAVRPLVIAGPDGDDAAAMMAAAGTAVIRLPYQSDHAMAVLQAGARALLMPSLAEGFGLPVVEAMAAGTAVLTSRDGALAEIAGGAALLVDPLNVDSIAQGIGRLDRDDGLCRDLGAQGRARAATFDASRFATRLRAVYAHPEMPPGGTASPAYPDTIVRKTFS